MNRKLDRLQDIRIENYIWVIYIIIIFISWYANSKEKKFILYNDEVSRMEYQNLLVLVFSILLIIYYYFTKSSYDDLNELTINDSNKKIILTYASFIASLLLFISGMIFLTIAIMAEEIDVELAFN